MRCRKRLVKHAKVLERMLRSVGSPGSNQFNAPQITFPGDKSESLQDIELLGEYCSTTHESYMRLCKHRLGQLKELVSRISQSTTPSDLQNLASLTKLAYQVRRSWSFQQLVAYNISRSKKRAVAVSDLRDTVERIGQISKFYRAAATLTAFLAKLQKSGRSIEIKATSTEKIEVTELASRTAAQVRRRGGGRFSSGGGAQIQNMMKRWPAYREHAELQLIIFYEQNHRLTLFSPYIGCNKRCCYLCYSFIKEHGRFQVDGCHQSLYSLWTVRETISFADEERAAAFKRALKRLCLDLEQKIQAQKGPHWRRPGFGTLNESVANLSRVSLAFNDGSSWERCSEERVKDAVAISTKNGSGAIPDKEYSVLSSTVDLKPVPEESPEEVTEAEMKCEPLRSDAPLPDNSVDVTDQSSYSHIERNVVAQQACSHTKATSLTASTEADLVPTQSLSGSPIARPVLGASAVNFSEDIPRDSQKPQIVDRPQRRHQRRDRWGQQTRHSRPPQYNPRASGRSNKGRGSAIDKAPLEKRRKRSAKIPERRTSQTSRPRVGHDRRRSLKQRLIGIVNVVLAAFRGLNRQESRLGSRPARK